MPVPGPRTRSSRPHYSQCCFAVPPPLGPEDNTLEPEHCSALADAREEGSHMALRCSAHCPRVSRGSSGR